MLDSEEYTAELRARLSSGESYAVCRQKAVAALAGEAAAQQLACANNNLGVEYCRALRHCGSRMQPVTLQRFGAAHDGAPREGIASATHIRALLYGGQTEEACAYMPAAAAQVLRRELAAGRAPAELKRAERAMLSRLRTMSEADFARYDRAGEGLYHRIYQAVRSGSGVEEILEAAKTRRYSHARLRRLLLCAWLNMPEIPEQVSYLRVLAADQVGRVLLRQMRDQGVPVLTKAADVAQLGDAAEALFYAEAIRTDLYTLTFPDLKQSVCGRDWRITPIMR